jgi:preprotein translocase subunit SecE
MSTQAQVPATTSDVVKQVFSALFVVAGLVAFYYFSDVRLLFRVLGLAVIAVVVFATMFTTQIGRNIWAFFLESRVEVRKVVWPSRDETTRTTLLVVAMVVIVGFILWGVDAFLFWAIRFLTGQGG